MSSSTRTATTTRKMNLRFDGRAGGAIVVATMETSIVTKNWAGSCVSLNQNASPREHRLPKLGRDLVEFFNNTVWALCVKLA
jgi:hypothetical protein